MYIRFSGHSLHELRHLLLRQVVEALQLGLLRALAAQVALQVLVLHDGPSRAVLRQAVAEGVLTFFGELK